MKQTLNMWQQLSVNLRYCYLARWSAQNMLASCSLPTIGKYNVLAQFDFCTRSTWHFQYWVDCPWR